MTDKDKPEVPLDFKVVGKFDDGALEVIAELLIDLVEAEDAREDKSGK